MSQVIKKITLLTLKTLLLLVGFSSYAQNILISGTVSDSLKTPLGYANILAIPTSDDQDIRYAVSKDNGSYKLGLAKHQTYNITVSYLGYTQADNSQQFSLEEIEFISQVALAHYCYGYSLEEIFDAN